MPLIVGKRHICVDFMLNITTLEDNHNYYYSMTNQYSFYQSIQILFHIYWYQAIFTYLQNLLMIFESIFILYYEKE